MVKLFAAVDSVGQIKFVGDVDRGIDCGCFCPSCASPLVSRQGSENQWHFAHVACQERPECLVGAMNLLRRLATQALRSRGELKFPNFAAPHPGRPLESIEWSAQLTEPPVWLEQNAPSDPIASIVLDEGVRGYIYLCLGDKPQATSAVGPLEHAGRRFIAQAVLHLPLPSYSTLVKRELAENFIAENAKLYWHYLPDWRGLVEAAASAAASAYNQQRAQMAGQRWGAIRKAIIERASGREHARQETAGHDEVHSRQPFTPLATASRPATFQPDGRSDPAAPKTRDGAALSTHSAPPWAPGALQHCSFQLRKLKDGTQWVMYQGARDGNKEMRIAPLPLIDGWDEYFPPRVAVVAEDGIYLVVKNYDAALAFFMDKAQSLLIDSNPAIVYRKASFGST